MFFFSLGIAAFLQLSFVILPIFVIVYFQKNYHYIKIIPLLFIVLLLDQFVLNLFRESNFFQFYWNWPGKILQALWPLIAIYFFKWMSSKEVGYNLPKNNTAWLWAVVLGILLPAILLLIGSLFGGLPEYQPIRPFTETLFFQFSIPGIAEELVFRGIILAIFNRYFIHPWKIFNVRVGWGLLFTTILFTAVHIVSYSSVTKRIIWDFNPAIDVFIMGFVFGWLREKTGSIWPSVLLHNFSNGFFFIGRWLITIIF